MENNQKRVVIASYKIVAWAVSVLLFILAMGVIGKTLLGGIVFAIAGLILLPPLNTLIANKFKLPYRLTIIASLLLFGVGASALPPSIKSTTTTVQVEKPSAEVNQQNIQPAPKMEPVKSVDAVPNDVVFDVPQLLHKNIDEITTMLGVPKDNSELTELQMQSGSDEWSKEYQKNGYVLTVTYHIKNRQVVDFFVSAPDEIYESRDKTKMFKLTNTNDTSSEYEVSFVNTLKDTTRFTGILIKAK